MFRAILMSLPLLCASLSATALPAPAHAAMADDEGSPCKTKKQKTRSKLFGSILGTVADNTIGRSGVGNFFAYNTVAQTLTDAIACKLDKQEQQKAAAATETVVERGEVGTSQSWTSDTRENVSGTSTVTGTLAQADGTRCMNVTDVVIVDGEETTVAKRMCRAPGASGYTVAQV